MTPYGIVLYSRTSDSRVKSVGTNGDIGANSLFNYVAATQGYIIHFGPDVEAAGTAVPVTFGASDRVAGESSARVTTYRKTANGFDSYLQLFNPGTGNDQLALTYSSIGVTSQHKSGLATYPAYTDIRTRSFAYGFEFPSTATPPTGTLNYSGVVIGEATYARNTLGAPVYRVSGTVQLAVVFATSQINGTITLKGTDDQSGAVVDLGTYSVSSSGGTIQITGSSGAATGVVPYSAYGPAAQELSGAAGVSVPRPEGTLYLSLAFATKR